MSIAEKLVIFLFRNRLRGASRFHAKFLDGRRLSVESKHGVLLRLDPHEYVEGFILREGYYEEEVLEAIAGQLAPGDVFWDIGSNLGLHSLTVAKLHSKVFVHAFEPNPAMAKLIRAAAEQNSVHVNVVETALDVSGGSATFYLHSGNAGRSSLHNWDNDSSLTKIEVLTARGDDVIASGNVPPPNMIKIDVEGNEQRVFEGMPRLLADRTLHTVVFEDAIDKSSGAKAILQSAGFEIQPLERREDTHHALANFVARRARV